MRLTIGLPRKVWRFVFAKQGDRYDKILREEEAQGLAIHLKRLAIIREDNGSRKELDRTIHEALHAACWPLSEEWVEFTGRDIARLLWARGWRRK